MGSERGRRAHTRILAKACPRIKRIGGAAAQPGEQIKKKKIYHNRGNKMVKRGGGIPSLNAPSNPLLHG